MIKYLKDVARTGKVQTMEEGWRQIEEHENNAVDQKRRHAEAATLAMGL